MDMGILAKAQSPALSLRQVRGEKIRQVSTQDVLVDFTDGLALVVPPFPFLSPKKSGDIPPTSKSPLSSPAALLALMAGNHNNTCHFIHWRYLSGQTNIHQLAAVGGTRASPLRRSAFHSAAYRSFFRISSNKFRHISCRW